MVEARTSKAKGIRNTGRAIVMIISRWEVLPNRREDQLLFILEELGMILRFPAWDVYKI